MSGCWWSPIILLSLLKFSQWETPQQSRRRRRWWMNICAVSGDARVCILIREPMWMELYSKACDLIDAAKARTTLHHPQGQVQRLNKSLVKILSKLISDRCRDCNTSVHELTGFTPYRLMFGREAILSLDAPLRCKTTTFPRVGTDIPWLCCWAEAAIGRDRADSEREPQASAEVLESLFWHQVPWSAVPCRRPGLV